MDQQPPLIVAIAGPTAVGKTALALELAERLGGEIISVDSRLVYRGMDIGTAKPTAEERRRVPHHLIDLCAPDEDFSLARFQSLAYAAIGAALGRSRLPLLAGGTGQYLAAILEGWNIPEVAPQPELRARLVEEAGRIGNAGLHGRLAEIDPAAAQSIDPSNLRRVIRALEVWEVTGRRISELQQRTPPPYRILALDLERPRDELYARIDARVGQMIRAGLIAEVLGLVAAGFDWDLPAMSSIGYGEWAPLWRGEATAAACAQQLKWNTHHFARKQGAWFRRLPGRIALPAGAADLIDQALAAIAAASAPAATHTDP
ncbi:MAG TPA: tRNA (adenosine(37)-N6)-dimethylallyltransferase MiaA [Herpetosiphonaceae bacterium]